MLQCYVMNGKAKFFAMFSYMLETFVAFIAVMFAPHMTASIAAAKGIALSMVMDKLILFGLIVLITIITNIIRALRYCRSSSGWPQSTGIWYGLQKGIICGFGSLIPYLIIGFVPVLAVPFGIIALIPGLSEFVNGFILSVFYLLSYAIFANPIYGSC